MKNIQLLIIALATMLTLTQGKGYGDVRIVIQLKHAQEKILRNCIAQEQKNITTQKIAQNLTPGQISQNIVSNSRRKFLTPSLSGFLAAYGGYMDISDKDGEIIFPRHQAAAKIYVALAPAIKLVQVKGNTFSHQEFEFGDESKLYVFERKIDRNKTTYWNVKETKIPKDKKINPITIVIFANPNNMYIPQGDFISEESGNLILPTIYVIGDTDQGKIFLQALDLKCYFERITKENKKTTDTTKQTIISNS